MNRSVTTLTVLILAGLLLCSCAAPGPKYITLAYTGTPEATAKGTLGIARFIDKRQDADRGKVGDRVLNDKSTETFLVQGLDLPGTLTDLTQTYLEKKGFVVTPVPAWKPDLQGMSRDQSGSDYLLTCVINKFGMKAKKKTAVTKMTLEIDLTLYLGTMAEKKLTTIPVAMILERTDIHFSAEKVEAFFNQTLAEVFEKALPLK